MARAVGESLLLTAWLSAAHILGFTLIMGSALLSNLRMLDAVLSRIPLVDVLRPTKYSILIGLVVSVTTGILLFSPRAGEVVENGTFQLKMSLLVASVLFHFIIQDRCAEVSRTGAVISRMVAATGLSLWTGLALTACWFILFE